MRGTPLVIAVVLTAVLAGCVAPTPQEAAGPEARTSGSDYVAEIRNATAGLDSSSPSEDVALARLRLANISDRLEADAAAGNVPDADLEEARALLVEEEDRLFWLALAIEARDHPVAAFRLAENKTAQGESRLDNATDWADAGKAKSDLMHAQGLVIGIQVYRPDAVPAEDLDALAARIEAALARADAWQAPEA